MEHKPRKSRPVVTAETAREFVRARPFRPFVVTTPSGRAFTIRHPEMVNVTEKEMVIYREDDPASGIPPGWYDKVPFLIIETITHMTKPTT